MANSIFRWASFATVILSTCIFLAATGCDFRFFNSTSRTPTATSLGTKVLPFDPIPFSQQHYSLCKRWTQWLNARISHIQLSENGSRILISTSGESAKEAPSSSGVRTRLFDEKGRVLFSRWFSQPVKRQDFSMQANLVAVSTYDDKLQVFDLKGKPLWVREHLGKPFILSTHKRILFFNDEDSEPSTAFFLYDFKGNLIKTAATVKEPVDIAIADDESWFAVIQGGGYIAIFDYDGNLQWQGALGGEIAALSLKNSVAEFYALVNPGPKLISYVLKNQELKQVWSINLDSNNEGRKYLALQYAPLKNSLYVYGNTKTSQAVAAVDSNSGSILWQHSYNHPALYVSSLQVSKGDAVVALDIDSVESSLDEYLTLLAVGPKGDVNWSARLHAPDGLYSFSVSEEPQRLAVGAGDPGNGLLVYFDRCK